MNYSTRTIDQLIYELVKLDKMLDKVKTQGGLWALGIGIKSCRAELDKRIKDPNKVNDLISNWKKENV